MNKVFTTRDRTQISRRGRDMVLLRKKNTYQVRHFMVGKDLKVTELFPDIFPKTLKLHRRYPNP